MVKCVSSFLLFSLFSIQAMSAENHIDLHQPKEKVVEDGKQSELEAMCRDWPFFSTRLGMLEMVFSKADLWLAD
ncbi:phosphoenolpyruvate carboxylase, partial [Salmonella enterica subsp. enterica serovar Montevideo]|nr:phosphoenolpyruvate carboxylase [Salmonella enterica subsp. enterica serovar Montevideo]